MFELTYEFGIATERYVWDELLLNIVEVNALGFAIVEHVREIILSVIQFIVGGITTDVSMTTINIVLLEIGCTWVIVRVILMISWFVVEVRVKE